MLASLHSNNNISLRSSQLCEFHKKGSLFLSSNLETKNYFKVVDRQLSYPNFWSKTPMTRAIWPRVISDFSVKNSAERYFKIPHFLFRIGPSSLIFNFIFLISIFYLTSQFCEIYPKSSLFWSSNLETKNYFNFV